jgi:hypothetical protein
MKKSTFVLLLTFLLLAVIGAWTNAQNPPGGYGAPANSGGGAGGGGAAPGGTNAAVQYNNSGAFGGSATWFLQPGSPQLAGVAPANIGIQGGGASVLTFNGSGNLNFSGATFTMAAGTRLGLADKGSCTMTAGACSAQALGSTYSAAPVCFANVTTVGGTQGFIRAPSTTTTVTPTSSSATETSTVNWACFGI